MKYLLLLPFLFFSFSTQADDDLKHYSFETKMNVASSQKLIKAMLAAGFNIETKEKALNLGDFRCEGQALDNYETTLKGSLECSSNNKTIHAPHAFLKSFKGSLSGVHVVQGKNPKDSIDARDLFSVESGTGHHWLIPNIDISCNTKNNICSVSGKIDFSKGDKCVGGVTCKEITDDTDWNKEHEFMKASSAPGKTN